MKKTLSLTEALTHLQALIKHLDLMDDRTAAQTGFLADLRRLQELLQNEENAEPTLAEINTSLFPGSTPESSRTAFAAFRREVKNSAQNLGHTLELCKENQRGKTPAQVRCHFEGVALKRLSEISKSTSKAVAGLDNLPSVEALAAGITEKERQELIVEFNPEDNNGRKTVRLFVSYAHFDDDLVAKLLARLKLELAISSTYSFQFWSDKGLLIGSAWDETIKTELTKSDLCLSLLSPAFFNSSYICENELPPVVNQIIPCIPVMLEPVNFGTQDLKGLEQVQIFRLPKNSELRSYSKCRGEVAKNFAAELAKQIEIITPSSLSRRAQSRLIEALANDSSRQELIARYPRIPNILAEAQTRQAKTTKRKNTESPARNRPKRPFERLLQSAISLDDEEALLEALGACSDLSELDSVVGQDSSHDYRQLRTKQDSALRIMTNWLSDPEAAPFAAVLGEVGSGKTTMLKMLAKRLSQDQQAPAVIFVDLRDYLHTAEMTLENILGEHLRRHDPDQALTVPNLIKAVQEEGALIIFDGLDEKIISLSDAARRSFISELWRVLPPGHLSKEEQEKRGHLVISCRSHYFPSVQAQSSGYLDSDRSGVTSKDYLTCIMLPWEEAQIESYLAQAIGEENVVKSLQVISEVHNLSDLAQRPYLLSLITPELEALEREKANNRPINAAALYKKFTERWLFRDDGKHVFTPRHKGLLMQSLAAALWRDQAREWPWEEVEDWLDEFLHEHPAIAENYQNLDPALLRQDLRTATFFVRPDSSSDSFRFAHTSLQEYFLANYLVENLLNSKNNTEAWSVPPPSLETFSFIQQIFELQNESKKARFLKTLAEILASENASSKSRLIVFQYSLFLINSSFPTPQFTAVNLSDLDLGELKITGAAESPITLPQAKFERTLLNASHFENVLFLDGSSWKGADIRGAKWLSCNLSHADFEETRTETSPPFYRNCNLNEAQLPKNATVWNSEHPKVCSKSFSVQPAIGHVNMILDWTIMPDSKTLVSGSRDGSIILWDPHSGQPIRSIISPSNSISSLDFSPDGKIVLSASYDSSPIFWDIASGKLIKSLKGPKIGTYSLEFSEDGKTILSNSHAGPSTLWNTVSGQQISSFESKYNLGFGGTLSHDGKTLLKCDDSNKFTLCNTGSGQETQSFPGLSHWIFAATFSPDDKSILFGNYEGNLALFSASSGEKIRTYEGHSGSITSLKFSQSGTVFLSGSGDGTVTLWDTDSTKKIRTFKNKFDSVMSADFFPCSSTVTSTSHDGSFNVWDSDSGQKIRSFKSSSNAISSLIHSHQKEEFISGFDDGTLAIWDKPSGRRILYIKGHSTTVSSIKLSLNGKFILSGSYDGSMFLWDAYSGKKVRSIELPTSPITDVAFSPDGKSILRRAIQDNIRCWDLAGNETAVPIEANEWLKSSDQPLSDDCTVLSSSRFLFKNTNILIREVIPLKNGSYLVLEPWNENEATKSYEDCRWRLVRGPKDAWRYVNAIDRETNTLYPAEYATEDGTWEINEPLSTDAED